jgi:hypothetical protein
MNLAELKAVALAANMQEWQRPRVYEALADMVSFRLAFNPEVALKLIAAVEAARPAMEAMEIGLEAKREEAEKYHQAMWGYRPDEHSRHDAEVAQIDSALSGVPTGGGAVMTASLPGCDPHLEWSLRYGNPEAVRFSAAAVVESFRLPAVRQRQHGRSDPSPASASRCGARLAPGSQADTSGSDQMKRILK